MHKQIGNKHRILTSTSYNLVVSTFSFRLLFRWETLVPGFSNRFLSNPSGFRFRPLVAAMTVGMYAHTQKDNSWPVLLWAHRVTDPLYCGRIKQQIFVWRTNILPCAQNQAAGLTNEDLNETSAPTGVTEKKPVGNEDEGDCAITGITKHSQIQVSKRRQKVPDSKDYQLISNRCMLNDWLINYSRIFFMTSFPLSKAWKTPFSVLSACSAFILVSSCKFCMTGNVTGWLFPTLAARKERLLILTVFSGTIKHHVKKLIASLVHEDGKALRVRVRSVQQQRNGVDCGVFAIAFVTSLFQSWLAMMTQRWDPIYWLVWNRSCWPQSVKQQNRHDEAHVYLSPTMA